MNLISLGKDSSAMKVKRDKTFWRVDGVDVSKYSVPRKNNGASYKRYTIQHRWDLQLKIYKGNVCFKV